MEVTLAKNIKEFRLRMGLNQDELADYLNVTREEISYFENGKRKVPVLFIPKLANLFGIDEYDLLEQDNAVVNLNLAFAFRANEISPDDLKVIADFKKIALNYLKIKKVLQENE